MGSQSKLDTAPVPVRWVGPLRLEGPEVADRLTVPLATYEKPLWPSVRRGARATDAAGGIRAVVVDERMTRSVLVQAPDASGALDAARFVQQHRPQIETLLSRHSRYARLLDIHPHHVGDLLFLRLELTTGDAAGHNMVTAAADQILTWLLEQRPELKYVSISGNFCTDKKPSAVNGILGRGRHVIAEATLPRGELDKHLRTTPEALVDLHVKKNLLGTMLAGGLRSANAHFANILLAVYLATGQDAANIVEGSQGQVHAETRGDDLYFSVNLPHLILGTVGSGKDLAFAEQNLERLGCREDRPPGDNARRLAVITAAAVLCGELSLLAAQTNPGELMNAHLRIERASS